MRRGWLLLILLLVSLNAGAYPVQVINSAIQVKGYVQTDTLYSRTGSKVIIQGWVVVDSAQVKSWHFLVSSDTLSLSARINGKLAIADTSYLHNQIVAKMDSIRAHVLIDPKMDSTRVNYLLNLKPSLSDSTVKYVTPAQMNTAIGGRADSSITINWPDTTLANRILTLAWALGWLDTSKVCFWQDTTLTNRLLTVAWAVGWLDTSKVVFWGDSLPGQMATKYGLSLKLNSADTAGTAYRAWVTACSTLTHNFAATKLSPSDTTGFLAYTKSLDALKAPINSPTFTGTVGGVTATMVGLGNVTNESKATMFTSPVFTTGATLPTPFTLGAVSMTATGTELNYVAGVTSAIQTQINGKKATGNYWHYCAAKTGTITASQYLLRPGDGSVMRSNFGYNVAYGCTIDRLSGGVNCTIKTTGNPVYLVVRKNGLAADSLSLTVNATGYFWGVDSTNTATFTPGDLLEMAINIGSFAGTLQDIWIDVYVK